MPDMTPEERVAALAPHLEEVQQAFVRDAIRAAIAEEREACAKIAWAAAEQARMNLGLVRGTVLQGHDIAAAIRARRA